LKSKLSPKKTTINEKKLDIKLGHAMKARLAPAKTAENEKKIDIKIGHALKAKLSPTKATDKKDKKPNVEEEKGTEQRVSSISERYSTK